MMSVTANIKEPCALFYMQIHFIVQSKINYLQSDFNMG
jgi:hypothetical protein